MAEIEQHVDIEQATGSHQKRRNADGRRDGRSTHAERERCRYGGYDGQAEARVPVGQNVSSLYCLREPMQCQLCEGDTDAES